MAINPLKAFLFVACGAGAAVATAYVSGALDPFLGPPRTEKVALAVPTETSPKQERLATAPATPATEPAAPVVPAKPEAAPAAPKEPQAAKPAVLAPSFDIVRVEPDGSIVVAGKAAPNSTVEIVAGSSVLGSTRVGGEGDFAIVLDEPLKPGGHELVLRSTTDDKVVATSPETAVVSVPENKDGQVLALVERPGEPSKLITVPEAKAAAPKVTAAVETPPAKPPVAPEPKPQPAPAPTAAATEPAPAPKPVAAASAPANVSVDAVEIEGRKVFVAGAAEPGQRMRVYANDILLGEAMTAPSGRFLVEAERDLPVGDYIIRADALEADGDKVVSRAAVPFEREPGEAVAAVAAVAPVAPVAPAKPASEPQAGQTQEPAAAASDDDAAKEPEKSVAAGEPAASPEPAPATPAAPDAVAEQPKLQHVDGSVIIRTGDTLWRISRRVYGRGVRYSTIYLANQDQITDPDRIWPGQVFNVPGRTKEGEPADLTAVKEQVPPAPL